MLIPQQKLNVPKFADFFRSNAASEKLLLDNFVTVSDKNYANDRNNRHIYWTGSGRCALRYILENIKQKHHFKDYELRIGLPSFTCHVVLDSILRARCTPIFIDSAEVLSVSSLKKTIKKIDALLLTYNFGFLPELEKIRKICSQRRTIIIEDCAQALGAAYGGRLAGSFGDHAFYSFGISKNIGFAGGLILSKDRLAVLPKASYPMMKALASVLKALSAGLFFNTLVYPISSKFLKAKLNKPQCSLDYGLPKFCQNVVINVLKDYGSALRLRTENAKLIMQELDGVIDFIKPIKNTQPSWLYFVLLSKNRDRLMAALRKEKVEIMPLLTYHDLSGKGKLAKQVEQQHCCFALCRSRGEIDYIIKKIRKVCKDETY